MKRYILITLGVVLALSGLWGGAYFMNAFGMAHWACFPTYMTAACSCAGGVLLAMNNIVEI